MDHDTLCFDIYPVNCYYDNASVWYYLACEVTFILLEYTVTYLLYGWGVEYIEECSWMLFVMDNIYRTYCL